MGEGEYYECSECHEEFDANHSECPSCGAANTFVKKHRDIEPTGLSTEVRDDKVAERTPEEIKEEVAAHVAELGGIPQRPIP
jgi:predicted ATP-dependent serine protease